MRVPKNMVLTGMVGGVDAIVAEFTHLSDGDGVADARESLNYVLRERAGSSPRLFGNSPYPRE
jgi:hypothetical protein